MSQLPMDDEGGMTTKRRQKMNKVDDRLSSLPDEILIAILSRLPLPLAFVTGVLSSRWRGLWTNVKSLDFGNHKFKNSAQFLAALKSVLTQIKSPVIDSFSVDLGHLIWQLHLDPPVNSLLNPLAERNVREIKVNWPFFWPISIPELPKFILQKPSLVSLELKTKFDWRLPDRLDAPNLKNLSITFLSMRRNEWVTQLIAACPSLEELSLTSNWGHGDYIECSNQNLRRLNIKIGPRRKHLKIHINAPKMEYLVIRAPDCVTYSFDEDPFELHVAKIETVTQDPPSNENWILPESYGARSDVMIPGYRMSALKTFLQRFATQLESRSI